MKKPGIKDLLIIAVVLAGAIWLYSKFLKLPSFKNLFTTQKVVIDQTPILIKDIRSIAQLVTVSSYDEVVVDSLVYNRTAAFLDAFRSVSPMAVLPSLQKQLVIIAKGKVLAGTDLQKLTENNIVIRGDTISLRLPPAQILEVVLNPGDFETFEERGVWSDAEVIAVKLKARQKITNRALQQNILTKADNKSRAILENFLKYAGFKVVTVTTSPT